MPAPLPQLVPSLLLSSSLQAVSALFYHEWHLPALGPHRSLQRRYPHSPLRVVDYEAIVAGEKDDIDTLYNPCTSIGFFYLKNHDVQPEPMYTVGENTFELPQGELDKFEHGDSRMSAGYKRAGLNNVDSLGNLDTAIYSGGILSAPLPLLAPAPPPHSRSNVHPVIPPTAPQHTYREPAIEEGPNGAL